MKRSERKEGIEIVVGLIDQCTIQSRGKKEPKKGIISIETQRISL